MQLTIHVKGQPVAFETPFVRNSQALAALAASHPKAGTFAADLVNKAGKYGLSEKQYAWVHKLAVETISPKVSPDAAVPAGTYMPIIALFAHAKQHLKRPKLKFHIPSFGPIALKLLPACHAK